MVVATEGRQNDLSKPTTSGKEAVMEVRKEKWLELAEIAAEEQDSARLLELVNQISQLLDQRTSFPAAAASLPSSDITL
jgi:hypothetical protein